MAGGTGWRLDTSGCAVAVVNQQHAKTRSVVHEQASRLPDPSWVWRRVLIFATAIVALTIAYQLSSRTTDVGTMREALRYSFWTIFLCLTLYGVGATVTDVTRMITAFLSTKKVTETFADLPSESAPPNEGAAAPGDGKLPPDQRVDHEP